MVRVRKLPLNDDGDSYYSGYRRDIKTKCPNCQMDGISVAGYFGNREDAEMCIPLEGDAAFCARCGATNKFQNGVLVPFPNWADGQPKDWVEKMEQLHEKAMRQYKSRE